MINTKPISSEYHSQLKREAKIKDEHEVIILSIIAGLSAYPIDAAIDTFVFREKAFLDQLIFEVPGEEIYFRSIILAMFIIFGIAISKILTRRKLAERALGTSEEMYRSIVELASDAIVTVDMKGIVTSCNAATTRMLGCSKDDIIGKHFRKLGFLRTRDIPKYLTIFSSALMGKVPKPFEAVGQRMDGTPFLAEVLVSLLRKDGKITGVQAIARDITERKEAEKAVRESQRKFERLFMSNPEAAVYSDLDDRVLDINPRFSELFGYSPDEAKGQLLDDLIVPDDLKEEARKLTAIREGYVYHDSVRQKKDGSLVPVSISSASIISENQNLGNVVQYKDISERKKMEKKLQENTEHLEELVEERTGELRKSEAKNRTIVNAIPDLMLQIGEDGTFLGVSGAKDVPSALPPSEFLGKKIHEVMPSEFAQKTMHYIKQALQTDKTQIFEYQLPIPLPNGNIHDYEARIVPSSRDEVLALVRDITERKQAEEKIRELENRYRAIFEGSTEGIVVADPKTARFVFVNPRICKLTGYDEKELLKRGVADIHPKKDLPYVMQEFKKATEGKIAPSMDIPVLRKDGSVIYCNIGGAHLKIGKQDLLVGFFRDITEHKRMEQQLLMSERLAVIGELATMVGHDLRNPLQSIENATYYLKNEYELKHSYPVGSKTKEMLQVIGDSINYADKILRDLQDFSSVRKLTLKKTDINTIVKEALTQVRASGNVELRTELSLLPEIEVDEDQMKRVFLNFITNGMQAMENGGKLTIATKKTADFIEVSFRDTGIGIPKENMDKIFKPLFTTKAKGMGMGLAICKKFVESHAGSIDVESQVGKGTTFTVKLPVQHEMEVTAIARE
ncbi:MAG TPA: PAS domain S-box protein [Candidatus Bathyarchaeia archaeon]|nr:PAS domain S-box protein [Candidatus Bathyarchaeia archaeon]